jgi:hypothetical protein
MAQGAVSSHRVLPYADTAGRPLLTLYFFIKVFVRSLRSVQGFAQSAEWYAAFKFSILNSQFSAYLLQQRPSLVVDISDAKQKK